MTLSRSKKIAEKGAIFALEDSWAEVLREELEQPYLEDLAAFVLEERNGRIPVYPPESLVFNALSLTPYEKVKVVVIGQDPYHGAGQAHGLSFSVPRGVPTPPSLLNIFKEIRDDLGIEVPSHGCLNGWAEQGVLLLNATLTVRQGEPLSHHGMGWERFTDAVVRALYTRKDPVIFVLWGKNAQEKLSQLKGIEKGPHTLLTAAHPSPLSVRQGFFGCRHFSKIDEILLGQGKEPIDWFLD
jgi:uracil-DNA glycosylase